MNAKDSATKKKRTPFGPVAETTAATLARYSPLDELPQPEYLEAQLDWRGNPEDTFSDWTIEIRSVSSYASNATEMDTYAVETYHVHRATLACGARKSDYFARLFRSNFNEGEQSRSYIELEALAARAFPRMLDFLYTADPLQIDTGTASALYALGDYFEIRPLRWEALQFVKKDISLDNLDMYYRHGKTFCSDDILLCSSRYIAKNIDTICLPPSIVTRPDPQFWANILEYAPTSDDSNASERLSEYLSQFCEQNAYGLDATIFRQLTDAKKLPHISAAAALRLCALDDKYCMENGGQQGSSTLKERCAAALADSWEDLGCGEDDLRLLRNQKSSFLVDLLTKSLDQAVNALMACHTELESIREELGTARATLRACKTKLASTRKELETAQETSELLEIKLRFAEQEIRKLAPLPEYHKLSSYGSGIPFDLERRYPNLGNSTLHYQGCPVFYYGEPNVGQLGRG